MAEPTGFGNRLEPREQGMGFKIQVLRKGPMELTLTELGKAVGIRGLFGVEGMHWREGQEAVRYLSGHVK